MSTPVPAPVPSVEPPSTTAPAVSPGVFLPWLIVMLVLGISLAQHVVMDPISEAIEQLDSTEVIDRNDQTGRIHLRPQARAEDQPV